MAVRVEDVQTSQAQAQTEAIVDAARAAIEQARSAARQIEADLGVDQILRELAELPDAIRRQQEAVRAARQAVDEARADVENIEAALMAVINTELDPRTGKPAFSNDTARKAELARRKSADEAYQAASKKLAEAQKALDGAQFDLDYLVNRFSAVRARARLTTERLALIGGGN